MQNTDLTQIGALAIVFIYFLKEFFAYLKAKKNKNGTGNYERELAAVNVKLGNHLTTVNGKIADIERDVSDIKVDIKIIGNNLEDIKIKLK